jgi:hypothetical protein
VSVNQASVMSKESITYGVPRAEKPGRIGRLRPHDLDTTAPLVSRR